MSRRRGQRRSTETTEATAAVAKESKAVEDLESEVARVEQQMLGTFGSPQRDAVDGLSQAFQRVMDDMAISSSVPADVVSIAHAVMQTRLADVRKVAVAAQVQAAPGSASTSARSGSTKRASSAPPGPVWRAAGRAG